MRTFMESKLPDNPNPWQARVEELRREHRVSLTAIEKATGKSKSSFYLYFSRTNTAPPTKLYTKTFNAKLAAILKTSPDELWRLWQQSQLNSGDSQIAMQGIHAFITNYPEQEIPKSLLLKLLGK